MIGSFVASLVSSTWGRYLMIGLALLAGVKTYGAVKHRDGRRAEVSRRQVETIKTMRRIQDAGNRVATDRASVAGRMRSGKF